MKALAFHPFFDIKYTDVLEMTKIWLLFDK
jgi:hypothetical protein